MTTAASALDEPHEAHEHPDRAALFDGVECVLESAHLNAPRCAAGAAICAAEGAAPIDLNGYSACGEAGGDGAEPTRQTIEQKARVNKLVQAISRDLRVFVLDHSLRWAATVRGAPPSVVAMLLAAETPAR